MAAIPTILKGDDSGAINITLASGRSYIGATLVVAYQGVTRSFTNLNPGQTVALTFTHEETATFSVKTAPLLMRLIGQYGAEETVENAEARIKVTDCLAEVNAGGSFIVTPGQAGSDPTKVPITDVGDMASRYTIADLQAKVNQIVRVLAQRSLLAFGGVALLASAAFGAVQTARLDALYNDSLVVTNVTDVSGEDTNAVHKTDAEWTGRVLSVNGQTGAVTISAGVETNAVKSLINSEVGGTNTLVHTDAISNMATKTWVGEQGYLTTHQSLEPATNYTDSVASGKQDTLTDYTTTNDVRAIVKDWGSTNYLEAINGVATLGKKIEDGGAGTLNVGRDGVVFGEYEYHSGKGTIHIGGTSYEKGGADGELYLGGHGESASGGKGKIVVGGISDLGGSGIGEVYIGGSSDYGHAGLGLIYLGGNADNGYGGNGEIEIGGSGYESNGDGKIRVGGGSKSNEFESAIGVGTITVYGDTASVKIGKTSKDGEVETWGNGTLILNGVNVGTTLADKLSSSVADSTSVYSTNILALARASSGSIATNVVADKVGGISNKLEYIEGYMAGQRVRISVTNYYGNTSGELPRLRIEEYITATNVVDGVDVETNYWQMVWDENNKYQQFYTNTTIAISGMTNDLYQTYYALLQERLNTKAPRAWGTLTSAGEAAPAGTVWHTEPNTVFAGGTEYAHAMVGSGVIGVLTSRGAAIYTDGETGRFHFTTDDRQYYFGMNVASRYELGCDTDGITVTQVASNNIVQLLYNVTMSGKPILYYKPTLTNAWSQITDSTGAAVPGAPVYASWDQAPPAGSEICTINGGRSLSGFFKAGIEYAGSSKFETNMMADLAGGVLATNQTTNQMQPIEPYISNGQVLWRIKQ